MNVSLNKLVKLGKNCQVPEILSEAWMKGHRGQNPLAEAFQYESEQRKLLNAGHLLLVIAIGGGLLFEMRLSAADYAAIGSRPLMALLGGVVMACPFAAIFCYWTAFRSIQKDYGNAAEFGRFLSDFSLRWNGTRPEELPHKPGDLSAFADNALVSALLWLMEHEDAQKPDGQPEAVAEYLGKRTELRNEVELRHRHLVLAGMADTDLETYIKKAKQRIRDKEEAAQKAKAA